MIYRRYRLPSCQLLCGRSATEGSWYVDPDRNHLNTIRRHVGIYRPVIHTVLGDILWDACVSDVYYRGLGICKLSV